ncbi:transcription factor MYB41-like [Hordeum vulgare subsp. vulgare]|uniref:Uncharacterized protein n=1 Tax=Hordeum vulgare subsp. vulgare TaxID=112509 RepID=A0A8I6YWZ9_HORVV|nr:transcription factor MYB41-like [Hordeum vulgare subsp. vulgare]KAI4971973.1 hypothetical protein ZWY2020_002898 [Hordeum vulgare]
MRTYLRATARPLPSRPLLLLSPSPYTSASPSPRCHHRVSILVQPFVSRISWRHLTADCRSAMAKQSCFHKKRMRRGLWSPEEDEKLMNHIAMYGHGCWSSVPKLAGLERCGKSCRLRWINYLRPDLKRGTFSQEEEDLIIRLHSMLGNKWSQIAAQLPGRTDNEVKNFWNSYIKKKLRERGIDPATHKPLAEATTSPTACRAVFGDAEVVPTATALAQDQVEKMLDSLKMPMDWPVGSVAGNGVPESYQVPSLQEGCAFHMGAHCGAFPSASSSSTLTTTDVGATTLPWLELGPTDTISGHVDQYAGALGELRWSDYFDGALQGQCVYDGGMVDDDAVQFDDIHGLSNWC